MDSFDTIKYVTELENIFQLNANDENAFWMAKYMKNKCAFYGLKKPLRADLFKEFSQLHKPPPPEKLEELCLMLWNIPEREMQYVAMELLFKYRKYTHTNTIKFYEQLITEKSWWDTVDLIAAKLVGFYFLKFPEMILPVTQSWMASGNMWLQRSCILFQLQYKNKTDIELLASYIEDCKSSKEFFLQKAIGWILREYAKTNPDWVLQYVSSASLKPLSKREALKHFKY
ncbi:MAG: DNA alkylation repair protein [Bacteroidales bacterium]|nr:DNA alkylation repair protein [Bacteroidales bacterium]